MSISEPCLRQSHIAPTSKIVLVSAVPIVRNVFSTVQSRSTMFCVMFCVIVTSQVGCDSSSHADGLDTGRGSSLWFIFALSWWRPVLICRIMERCYLSHFPCRLIIYSLFNLFILFIKYSYFSFAISPLSLYTSFIWYSIVHKCMY